MSKVKLGSPSGDVEKEHTSSPFSEFVKDPSAILNSSGPLDSPEKRPQSPLKHDTSASSLLLGSKSDDDLETLSCKIHDKRRAKKILRNGTWPSDHPIRYKLWKLLGELFSKLYHQHEVYNEALKCVFGDELVKDGVETIVTSSLPSFVDRRFISTRHLSSKGVHAVYRIMAVISYERPDVVYCPTLFPLAATLLHYFAEEECYACISSLVTRKCKERFVTQTRTAYEASGFVFKKLALKYCKSSCQYLDKCAVELDLFFEDWVFWIFNHLPFGHLVRVMDCYLYEGPKILYRVGLAILFNFYKNKDKMEIVKTSDVQQKMEWFCSNINIPPNKLLKTAFGFRGLSRSLMMRLITKQEMTVSSRDNAAILQANVPSSTSTGSLNMLVSTATNSQLLSRKERLDVMINRNRSCSQGMEVVFMFANVKSQLLKFEQWKHIYDWLPKRMTLKRPNLIFSTSEHGTSLNTFYNKVEGHDPTLIIIHTSSDDLIGSYCTGDWSERRKKLGSSSGTNSKYFGSGENFVFTIQPKAMKYGWVGVNTATTTTAVSNVTSEITGGKSHQTFKTSIGGSSRGFPFGEKQGKPKNPKERMVLNETHEKSISLDDDPSIVKNSNKAKNNRGDVGDDGNVDLNSVDPCTAYTTSSGIEGTTKDDNDDDDDGNGGAGGDDDDDDDGTLISVSMESECDVRKVKLKPGASLFATGDAMRISIGGGNGEAIYLDDNLCNGASNHCDTFNNPPLVTGGRFTVHILEVFEFV